MQAVSAATLEGAPGHADARADDIVNANACAPKMGEISLEMGVRLRSIGERAKIEFLAELNER